MGAKSILNTFIKQDIAIDLKDSRLDIPQEKKRVNYGTHFDKKYIVCRSQARDSAEIEENPDPTVDYGFLHGKAMYCFRWK